MFSFADVYLGEPTQDALINAFIEANIRPADLFPLAQGFWPRSMTGTPIFDQTAWPYRPVRINTLYWPWGASRFAHAFFVAGDVQMAKIRQAVGNDDTPQTLVMDDGAGNSISTLMSMLPALPLQVLPTAPDQGMWLVTLVDDRYWWWDTLLSFTVDGQSTAWTDIYSAVGDVIGATIQVDPIPGAYGIPPVDYLIEKRPTPPYLDCVAFSVGQKIVRWLDGTVHAQNYSTAAANTQGQIGLYRQYAGGQLALTPG